MEANDRIPMDVMKHKDHHLDTLHKFISSAEQQLQSGQLCPRLLAILTLL